MFPLFSFVTAVEHKQITNCWNKENGMWLSEIQYNMTKHMT